MASVEERLAGLEGVVGQISIRLERVEKQIDERFAAMERRMEERFEAMERRFERMEHRFERVDDDAKTNFRWMVGIMLTMWVSIILTVLFK